MLRFVEQGLFAYESVGAKALTSRNKTGDVQITEFPAALLLCHCA